jgi:catechol 2,3-dioxygenase-like lactoylglutathione lyase family enzyme
VRIDHVIYATSDLDAAARRMQTILGLQVRPGGRHEGLGTENRIVPLGDGYIELLAVADPDEAAASDLGRAVQTAIASAGDGLMAWAVEVDDAGEVAERLGISSSRISRQGLTAALAGLEEAMREPWLPFFISRDHGIPDPGGDAAGGIAWIEVAGDADRLREWLGGADLPVRNADGAPGVRAVGIGGRELR